MTHNVAQLLLGVEISDFLLTSSTYYFKGDERQKQKTDGGVSKNK